ncbi:hypothetical protein SAY86_000583 [Trapa natans]|uniref:Uncharacterized protein n=1 Tax=Trapa natans TaxID=22666 RepID=A0AAN7MAI8_TRANT|nr:hypothetical protein SAY86_000583 [Trapa natans]
MGSREKVGETEEGERQQLGKKKVKAEKAKAEGILLVERRGGGPSTPSPTWRLELSSHEGDSSFSPIQQFLSHPSAPRASTVSARKLCANLWEVQPYQTISMSRRAVKPRRNKGFDLDPPSVPPDESATEHDTQKTTLTSPLQQNCRWNGTAVRPVSSASYCSSMEVAPYIPPVTPVSSLDWRAQTIESSYSLRTSTELLKVLNRIWSLEEQHASNSSLAKALKSELIGSRARIKELLRERQKDKQIIGDMMKQAEVDKQKEVESAVKTLRRDIEEERELRKFSDSERRKLSKEISVLKSGFSTALLEIERERKARVLLESLCDEFAEGIRDYDLVVQSLKHKIAEDYVDGEGFDQSILHISEAWLDERIQMEQARAHHNLSEDTIVDRLSPDIETFLLSKKKYGETDGKGHSTGKGVNEKFSQGHYSMESFPFNPLGSAPKIDKEEKSLGNDFQLTERRNAKEVRDSSKRMVTSDSMEVYKDACRSSDPCAAPVPCSHIMAYESVDADERKTNHLNLGDQLDGLEKRSRIWGLKSSPYHAHQNLHRNHSLSSKGDRIRIQSISPGEDSCDQSLIHRGQRSPVQSWKFKLNSPDIDLSEASARLPPGVKENTLIAKLLEARLESQQSRSRAYRSSV